MKSRQTIIHKVLQAFLEDKLPISIKTEGNLKSEQKLLSKMLLRRGKNNDIGMSIEPARKLIWFRRRK